MTTTNDTLEEFPRQAARTQRFSLGLPRSFEIAPDGSRVAFLRSRAGDDPVTCLWVLDVASGRERVVFDPRQHGAGGEGDLTEAERARRERARERAAGVVQFATDKDVRRAVFVLDGKLMLADLLAGGAQELTTRGPVDDPRLDPSGEHVAYVSNGALRIRSIEGDDRLIVQDGDPDVRWGLPEFVAAEEMRRLRGHWWSPDGSKIAATRVDERPVNVWYLSDPSDPAAKPRAIRYPAAGTPNAVVLLAIFDVATGRRTDVGWDLESFPYLARVVWTESAPPTLLVQTRDQRTARVVEVDETTGATRIVREDTDPDWIELIPGSPARLSDGTLVTTADSEDTRRLVVGESPVTPPGLQVLSILDAGDDVLFAATDDPTQVHVWRWHPGAALERLTQRPGVHSATESGDVTVVSSSVEDDLRPSFSVLIDGAEKARIESLVETPVVDPQPRFFRLGPNELDAALLLPGGQEPSEPLPVLMDPYGGPYHNVVVRSKRSFAESQWFAEHGFAVLIVDDRGSQGRGPAWERLLRRNFVMTVDDQADALAAAGGRFPFLDTERVAIRGWSFGGELAAACVLRRPDVFHAAISGAPVTNHLLYDTHYQERFLGDPNDEPEVYRQNSLLADAANLSRPLLLIHGLSDDNVLPAHTLQLSARLFEAGKHHELVLLPNASHMANSKVMTENLLRLELGFLRRTIGAGHG
jgi:dipeptidyl-peptidase-4